MECVAARTDVHHSDTQLLQVRQGDPAHGGADAVTMCLRVHSDHHQSARAVGADLPADVPQESVTVLGVLREGDEAIGLGIVKRGNLLAVAVLSVAMIVRVHQWV